MHRTLRRQSATFFILVAATFARSAAAQTLPGRGGELPPGFTTLPLGAVAAPVVPPAAATTVQLPTFNFFTISTSVLVPDRGGVQLGGVGGGVQAGRADGAPGLPGLRGGGASTGAGAIGVTAHVHDLQALDRALLGDQAPSPADRRLARWHDRLARARESSAGRPSISVADARARARP